MQRAAYTTKLKGLTLTEVILAIAIFSSISIGVALYFSRIWESQRFALESSQAQLAASEGVSNTLEHIRNMRQSDAGSYPLVSADANDIVFYGDYDGDGDAERLHYYFDTDSDTLFLGVREPIAGTPPTYPAGDGSIEAVSLNVRNESGEDIFHYFDNLNRSISAPVENIADVRMVEMDIYVDINPSSSPEPAHFESFASIRNLNEYDRPN